MRRLGTSSFTIIMAATLMVAPQANADRSFTSISRLQRDFKSRLEPALSSSFHFRLEPGIDCTGTYISQTGHFITALHCVAGCLASHKAIRKERAHEEPTRQFKVTDRRTGDYEIKNLFTYTMTVDEDRLDEGVECPIQIGNTRSTAEIVLTGGKGWLTPKETLARFSQKFPEDYKQLLNDGYEHGYDFAILKTPQKTARNCLPLAPRAPIWAESLHSISFPCVDRETMSTSGQTPLYTGGIRTSGIKASEYFKKNARSLPFKTEFVDRPDTFFSTLDMEKCGSGTAVLDNRLAVVGIATRVYKTSNEYERGSLESVNVAQVWRDLYDKKSGSDIKEITTCNNQRPRAVVPFAKRAIRAEKRRSFKNRETSIPNHRREPNAA